MAIKKTTIRKQHDKTLLTIKEILENFFYGIGAVGLFFLFASWGLLVRCLLLKT
jgi:hypothetical protein